VTDAVWAYLDTRDLLRLTLQESRIDFVALERLIRRKRLSAIDPVLDFVETTRDAPSRERLLNLLVSQLGDECAVPLIQRINYARGDLQKDFLVALGRVPDIPPYFDATRFLLSTDATVRREAIRIMVRIPDAREGALM